MTLHFVLPGSIDRQTGGTIYDRRVVEGLRARGMAVQVHELPDRFPIPDAADLKAADDLLASLPDGAAAVVDGLAFGAMPEAATAHAGRLRLVALVHHPLALETGLSSDAAARLRTSETVALKAARRVIVTSPVTRDSLVRDFGVPAEACAVVAPGTDRAEVAAGSGEETQDLALLSVGSLIPRKGHDVLIEALAPLAGRPWHLTVAGPGEHDPATAQALRDLIAARGLDDRVTLTGALPPDRLDRAYADADVFVLASHYEGFGMVLTEALARGLPIVSTTGGAIPATVPEGAGLLVPPGDAVALGQALARVMDEPALRRRLRDGAMAARDALPDWTDTTDRFAAALEVSR
ncbi:glycosyltransferase family 4 protein [Caenispirillum salinarum]|uniref:glycosyltransferase family 4 protein n=1 Tax=Caenispirillum salinarum TaxID=859058 RepID=UPI00384DA84F